MLINSAQLHALFTALEGSVTYPNFKSRIAGLAAQRDKLAAYHHLWEQLRRLQEP